MMVKMSLRDIQKVSVDILKEIDIFCQENSINYSIGYGGLIGAVRHKGCIPWDDDLDIVMPRPDYEKFVKTYYSHDGSFKVYAPELSNCYYTVSRICDMKRTYVRKSVQWNDDQNGVWVDIFPIDGIVEEKEMLWKSSTKCYVACRNKKLISFKQSFHYNLKSIALLIKYGLLDRSCCINNYLTSISKCEFDTASMVGNYASPYRNRDIHRKEVFEEYYRVPFEDTEVCIIKNFDEYLTSIYGDYMQLPPLDKRGIRSHSSNDFYWKE